MVPQTAGLSNRPSTTLPKSAATIIKLKRPLDLHGVCASSAREAASFPVRTDRAQPVKSPTIVAPDARMSANVHDRTWRVCFPPGILPGRATKTGPSEGAPTLRRGNLNSPSHDTRQRPQHRRFPQPIHARENVRPKMRVARTIRQVDIEPLKRPNSFGDEVQQRHAYIIYPVALRPLVILGL